MTEPVIENEPLATGRQRRAILGLVVFAVLLLPVLVGLGFWQLDRADQKEQLLHSLQVRKELPPLSAAHIGEPNPEWRHRQVMLSGEYDPTRQWLLDNRVHKGRFGYEVVTAFRVEPQDQWILVNRGWLPASLKREELPELPVPAGRQELLGTLDDLSADRLVLKDPPQETGWPRRVQVLDLKAAQADSQREFSPWLVRLPASQPGALVPIHQPAPMGPEKHLGYAFQWFGLALVLLVGSVIAVVRIRKESI